MRSPRLVLCLALAGCHAPPRSAAYFEAHPEETAQVLAACSRGVRLARECANARQGQAAIERKARMELYHRSFQ